MPTDPTEMAIAMPTACPLPVWTTRHFIDLMSKLIGKRPKSLRIKRAVIGYLRLFGHGKIISVVAPASDITIKRGIVESDD